MSKLEVDTIDTKTGTNSLTIKQNDTAAITIDTSQSVGIGTTTPSTGYGGTISNVKLALRNDGSGGNNGTSTLLIGGDNNHYSYISSEHTGGGATYLAFGTAGGASNPVERCRIDSSGNVGIGTTSPSCALNVNDGFLQIDSGSTQGIRIGSTDNFVGGTDNDAALQSNTGKNMRFYVGGSEAMRITSSTDILINKTANNFNTAGVILNSAGNCFFTAAGNSGVNVNRLSDDGALVRFYQDNTEEGNISVSGSTVSYNGFTGTHWSRLSDNSKPTILKGTILESLDEMMDWYQVQFDITETDDEGNETTRTEKQSYALGDGESVGDVITYAYEDTDYQATIIQEGDIKHTKSKISDTVDAKNVYGVFMDWDNDDGTVNDMYVAQTGTFVVRINGSETVSKGDLIQSNGDGTGKVQADDIIRSSTVAKVLSTTKIETYEDGSYIVPCSLHC